MPPVARILDPEPVPSLAAYLERGGGRGIAEARRLGPAATVDLVRAAGIRGRGGAGFPTGVKWHTVATNASDLAPTSVVSNWLREIERFAPTLTTALWHGAGRKDKMEELETANVVIARLTCSKTAVAFS